MAQPFKQARDYFRQKVNIPTKAYDDLMREAHDRAFTVAGAMDEALLVDMRQAVDKAILQKQGLKAFRRDFDKIVEKHGWSYNLNRNQRTKVIFETNLNSAYGAGRYQQMSHPDVVKLRPYWTYHHTAQRHPRTNHIALDGITLAHDNPFWDTHYPPNGFCCKCYVTSTTKRELQRRGKAGPDPTPALKTKRWIDKRTGHVSDVPVGVDPSFAYTPSKSFMKSQIPPRFLKPLPISRVGNPKPDNLPPLKDFAKPIKAPLIEDGLTDVQYVNLFLKGFGASIEKPAYYRDVTGTVVVVGVDMFLKDKKKGPVVGNFKVDKKGRDQHLLRLGEAFQDPDEVWLQWAKNINKRAKPFLKRVYLRYDPVTQTVAVFSWTKKGWNGVTVFKGNYEDYLESQRRGAFLYQRDKK